jgi:predicted DNA binding CopG/RHH family protein
MQTKNKRSIAKKLPTPEFKSEAEEARWYEKNQDALLTEFKNAAKDGTLGRGTLAKRGLTPTTTIRLDKRDIELAKRQAEQRGLRYQTYLKMLIHQALRAEGPRTPPAC